MELGAIKNIHRLQLMELGVIKVRNSGLQLMELRTIKVR